MRRTRRQNTLQARCAGSARLKALLALLALAWALGSGGCALVRQAALDELADALAGGGSAFARDDDPDLVKAAVPFSLKLLESLLAEAPEHPGLLLAAAKGFTQYAYGFVQQEADELESRDVAAAEALRLRARRLYLRGRDYGLRGLDVQHAGFSQALLANPRAAAASAAPADVPLLFWTAAAWGGAIALAKDTPDLIAQLPAMEALIDRALALDERFDRGAIHGFLIAYEMSRPGAPGDPAARARAHFERAMALSEDADPSPLVALAEAVAVQQQNVKEFEALLHRALAINPDAHPDTRLQTLIVQRRARWLLSRKADLFLIDNQ
jgi:predicted anti-sigma-YlaC factor YlaD